MIRKPTFLWQGLLIVLPVLLLAAAGIVSLWKDRETVTLDARGTAAVYAEHLAAYLSTELDLASHRSDKTAHGASQQPGEGYAGPSAPIQSVWPHGSTVDSEGHLVSVGPHRAPAEYPRVPTVEPYPAERLDGQAANLWNEAQSVEATDRESGLKAYERFLASEPPEPFYSNAQYSRALLLAATGRNEAALDVLGLLDQTPEVTETGLPLAVLVRFQRVRLLAEESRRGTVRTEALTAAIHDFSTMVIEQASLATPSLLNAVIGFLEGFGENYSAPIRASQRVWSVDEDTREFYRTVRPLLQTPINAEQAFWTESNDRPRLVVLIPYEQPATDGAPKDVRFEMHIHSEEFLRHAIDSLLSRAPLRPPPYSEPAVFLRGRRVSTTEPHGEVLATVESDLATGQASIAGLTVALHLVDPDLLYARQRQRAFWFGALILIAAVAALTGYVTAHRAFRRQLHLNEMKSNFVAGVSHELRVPIASVRLMAERLERGAVKQPEKRHSYFLFIAQECRRLSSLVENLLDFSRIEQGRKEYETELTDMAALVRHTTDLMQPCALESRVRLGTQIDPGFPAGASHTEVDGKAVQQALVNLIDNAIKHSPSNAAVTVGLSRGNGDGTIRLSVTDTGEGIPSDEYERIFERFYRLGSRMRRETQGAGIGLSIVRHIVEAHGGRIHVESKVGEGSRFVIEIPAGRPNRIASADRDDSSQY